MSTIQTIPARSGIAVHLKKGQSIKVINTHGKQVVDFFAFSSEDHTEYLSMSHTRAAHSRLIPAVGETFTTNRRKPMFTFLEDATPGVHDGLIAACDIYRYQGLGVSEYHANCSDNLLNGLKDLGVGWEPTHIPQPLNLFMNIPVETDQGLKWEEPASSKGQFVKLRAEMDLVVGMSACPQDIIKINAMTPVDAHFAIE